MLLASFRYHALPFVYFIYAVFSVVKLNMPILLGVALSLLFLIAGIIRLPPIAQWKKGSKHFIWGILDEVMILLGGFGILLAFLLTKSKAFLIVAVFIIFLSILGLLSGIIGCRYKSKNDEQ